MGAAGLGGASGTCSQEGERMSQETVPWRPASAAFLRPGELGSQLGSRSVEVQLRMGRGRG